MLDTLKIAKRLEHARLSAEQAEAIAESIAEATKLDLKEAELHLSEKITQSERASRNLIFGTYGLIIVSVIVNHFWR